MYVGLCMYVHTSVYRTCGAAHKMKDAWWRHNFVKSVGGLFVERKRIYAVLLFISWQLIGSNLNMLSSQYKGNWMDCND
jgi:hypothetical protein